MRVICIHIYTRGGTFEIWPEGLLTWEDIDLARTRKRVARTADIDANCIGAIHLYGSEDSNNHVVIAEEVKESDS